MDIAQAFKDLNPRGLRELNHTLGLFDTLSLSARYSFSSDQYHSAAQQFALTGEMADPINTLFHETTHLYQATSTPYGYYCACLRQFQSNQVAALIKLLSSRYGGIERYPIVWTLQLMTPRDKYKEIWGVLHLWYIAELLRIYLEGNGLSYMKQRVNNPFSLSHPVIKLFSEMEHYLVQFLELTGKRIGTTGRWQGLDSQEYLHEQEQVDLVIQAAGGLTLDGLLESWASMSEDHTDHSSTEDTSCTVSFRNRAKHQYFLDHARQHLKAGSSFEFCRAYTAICELALCSPLLPYQHVPRSTREAWIHISPIGRFLTACSESVAVPLPNKSNTDYARYQREICDRIGWQTPESTARATMTAFTYPPMDWAAHLYYEAQRFRVLNPLSFVDMSVWYSGNGTSSWSTLPPDIAKEFRRYFVHPVIEFSDRVLLHKNREYVLYFIIQHTIAQYLRSLLLSDNPTVELPFKASDAQLSFLSSALANYSRLQLGLKNPIINLKSGAKLQ